VQGTGICFLTRRQIQPLPYKFLAFRKLCRQFLESPKNLTGKEARPHIRQNPNNLLKICEIGWNLRFETLRGSSSFAINDLRRSMRRKNARYITVCTTEILASV
jgi:hypothetical protein